MNGLSFGYPWLVGLAIVFVSLAWWALSLERRWWQKALAAFGEESVFAVASALPTTRARLSSHVLQVSAIALGLLALARPQLGEQSASAAQRGRDVLVLLDLSRSMNAADQSSSRLVVAKSAIARVLAAVPKDRVGLIVFGGSAFLQLPLTGNHPAFQRFLDAASTDDLGDPGTDLSSALSAAATVFEHDGERGYQSILVASDGESVSGDVAPPLTRLSKAGIPVFTMGIGSAQGAPIPADSAAAPEKWHRDHIGRVVVSRLEEGELRRAAAATGGLFVQATPQDLQRLSAALTKMQTRTLASSESSERMDRYQWPLTLALLTLAAAPAVTASRKRRRS
jgi:Ca-activated chloride channel family protein